MNDSVVNFHVNNFVKFYLAADNLIFLISLLSKIRNKILGFEFWLHVNFFQPKKFILIHDSDLKFTSLFVVYFGNHELYEELK